MFDQNLGNNTSDSTGIVDDAFDKNLATTAGLCVAMGTGSLGAVVFLATAPAHALVGGTLAGGLLYVGDRQFKGKSLNPFVKDEDTSTEPAAAESVTVEATATA